MTDKDQNFFPAFQLALVDANNKAFPYRWNCSPVSKTGLDKSFEFVVKKETSLQNNNQNYTSYHTYISGSSNPYAVSFLSNNLNPLIIPMPVSGKNFSSISYFVQNASLEQQENFWQKASIEFTKELNRNGETKWLCTEGLAVSYLHVRIDKSVNNNAPSSLFFADYKNPNYTPISAPQTPKEKLLANLDKICLDPYGYLANNEYLKTDEAEEEYERIFDPDRKDPWKNRYLKIVIGGSEIDLETFLQENNGNDYVEVKKELIKKIKQEISKTPQSGKSIKTQTSQLSTKKPVGNIEDTAFLLFEDRNKQIKEEKIEPKLKIF